MIASDVGVRPKKSELCQFKKDQGPFVQSVASLMKWLIEDLLSVLVLTKSIVVIFFAEKVRGAFASLKATHIFSTKMSVFFIYVTGSGILGLIEVHGRNLDFNII